MKILAIQTRPGIGDMCVFLPLIHEISKRENVKISILAKKRSCCDELVQHDPYIEEVIYYPDKFNFNFLNLLKSKNFKKSFIFHYGVKYCLLSKITNIKKIFNYGFFKKKVSITYEAKKKTEIWLKEKNIKTNCKIFLKEEVKKENSIVIGIGGSGLTKKWKLENYVELINKIKKNYPLKKIIVAGGKNEKNDYEFIKKKLSNIQIESLCEKKISECLNIIAGSLMYIGNDTGFMHISGMLGLKSFGLFGDTPIDYCNYNPLIRPIIPKNFKSVGHNSRAINEITFDWVYDNISNDIKILNN